MGRWEEVDAPTEALDVVVQPFAAGEGGGVFVRVEDRFLTAAPFVNVYSLPLERLLRLPGHLKFYRCRC